MVGSATTASGSSSRDVDRHHLVLASETFPARSTPTTWGKVSVWGFEPDTHLYNPRTPAVDTTSARPLERNAEHRPDERGAGDHRRADHDDERCSEQSRSR